MYDVTSHVHKALETTSNELPIGQSLRQPPSRQNYGTPSAANQKMLGAVLVLCSLYLGPTTAWPLSRTSSQRALSAKTMALDHRDPF